LACAGFTSSLDDQTRELAAFITDDGFGILEQYPAEATTSIYGIFMAFSLSVNA